MERGNTEADRTEYSWYLRMIIRKALMNEGCFVREDNFDQMLPFGCYFDPSDEELGTLLFKKMNNENMPLHKICEVDVYASSPGELTGKSI